LAARGHTVEVFTTSIDGPRNRRCVRQAGDAGWRQNPLFRVASDATFRGTGAGRALRREIAGADVAHLHSVFLCRPGRGAAGAESQYRTYLASRMLVEKLVKAVTLTKSPGSA